MKFALFNEQRIEATKGVKGFCPACGAELIANCGEIKIHYWRHKGKRNCDLWWENETEWHRAWKNHFSQEWQEKVHFDEKSSEKHIADVKTDSGWVLEFQYSHIDPEERLSRNSFYPKLVWVLNGLRRQRDKPAFHRIRDEYAILSIDPRFEHVMGANDCRLIKEWHETNALIFMDFQDVDKENRAIIWLLFPRIVDDHAYLWPILQSEFIEAHINNTFDEVVEKVISPFIANLRKEEKSRVEMEEFRLRNRLREEKERMNLLWYGTRNPR